jgi:hypothetical protein
MVTSSFLLPLPIPTDPVYRYMYTSTPLTRSGFDALTPWAKSAMPDISGLRLQANWDGMRDFPLPLNLINMEWTPGSLQWPVIPLPINFLTASH